jgi:uncharacterized protein (DUF302 family)
MFKFIFLTSLVYFFTACSSKEIPVYEFNTEDMIRVETTHTPLSVEERLLSLLSENGFQHINTIDHQSRAKNIGANIYEERIIYFGKPEIAIPLLRCRQTIGIDLPFRISIYKNEDEQTFLLYNDPLKLIEKHSFFDSDCKNILTDVSGIIYEIVKTSAVGVSTSEAVFELEEEAIAEMEDEKREDEIDEALKEIEKED